MKRIGLSLIFGALFLLNSGLNYANTDKSQELQPAASGEVEITMLKYKFIPEVMEIKAGQTVRWVNKEKRQYHSVWFEQLGEAESDYLFPDESFQKTFNKPGKYPYRCGPHEEMTGIIIVR